MPNGLDAPDARLAVVETVQKGLIKDVDETKDHMKSVDARLSRLEKILLVIMAISAVGGSDAALNVVGKLTSLVGG